MSSVLHLCSPYVAGKHTSTVSLRCTSACTSAHRVPSVKFPRSRCAAGESLLEMHGHCGPASARPKSSSNPRREAGRGYAMARAHARQPRSSQVWPKRASRFQCASWGLTVLLRVSVPGGPPGRRRRGADTAPPGKPSVPGGPRPACGCAPPCHLQELAAHPLPGHDAERRAALRPPPPARPAPRRRPARRSGTRTSSRRRSFRRHRAGAS